MNFHDTLPKHNILPIYRDAILNFNSGSELWILHGYGFVLLMIDKIQQILIIRLVAFVTPWQKYPGDY